jgi:hypothetical protein
MIIKMLRKQSVIHSDDLIGSTTISVMLPISFNLTILFIRNRIGKSKGPTQPI